MGGAKEWYDSVAPPYSYIHVDGFSSPKDLSKYLISLGKVHTQHLRTTSALAKIFLYKFLSKILYISHSYSLRA